MHRVLLTIATVTISAATLAGDRSATAPAAFTGYAYDLTTRQLVYREIHEPRLADGADILRTTYQAPDGSTLAVRHADFSANPLLPSFHLEDARTGYLEGTRASAGSVVVFSRESALGSLDEKPLTDDGRTVADAGFDRFIRHQWQALLRGERLEVDFVVPSRLSSLTFVVSRHGAGKIRGEPTVSFRMVPKNRLIRLFVDPIDVTYHRDRRLLLRYVGMSNLRDESGEPYRVRIEFPPEERLG